ncbi:unnamed protein product [Paramecium sonneborni]|uniref:Uncharacterized protein n=1 Tax=Paramecium sonneborni TaxID=65129 RepID=A0A8S1QE09_9CILI|nr:unnamed protein product [Paramecium sonneborni]
MSYNTYGYEEEKIPAYDAQFDNFEEIPQILDIYSTTCQSPKSFKLSIHKHHTGSSKYIRKIKKTKKQKLNQYTSEEKNFIINQIGSEGFITHFIQQNNKSLFLQDKGYLKITKKLEKISLQ